MRGRGGRDGGKEEERMSGIEGKREGRSRKKRRREGRRERRRAIMRDREGGEER